MRWPCRNAGAASGRRQHPVEAKADEGDDQAAAHDEGEARIPSARGNGGEVEEILDLLRIGHARECQAEAEDHAGEKRGEEAGSGARHQTTCLAMKTVTMAAAMKVPTATKERGESRASPQMPCPEVQPRLMRVPTPTRSPAAIRPKDERSTAGAVDGISARIARSGEGAEPGADRQADQEDDAPEDVAAADREDRARRWWKSRRSARSRPRAASRQGR